MGKKISFSLSPREIAKAQQELKEWKRWVLKKTKELNERLATVGAAEASRKFGAAMYDGENDVQVTASPIDGGWVIKAEGKAVCFIEFGSGVYHNTGEPYPAPRPPGIVGIGEYGQGKGKRKGWVFFSESGEKVFTRGNPASMPMYLAGEKIKNEIVSIAREVFSNG